MPDLRERVKHIVFGTPAHAQVAALGLKRRFRALHAERQDVVRQWEDVIESMKRRDVAIADASRDFAKRRKEIRAKRAVLSERARFLEQELQNNKESDVAIGEADRGMARLREQKEAESKERQALADETDAAKNALRRAAAELSALDGDNAQKREALRAKHAKLEKTRARLEKASKRLEAEKEEEDQAKGITSLRVPPRRYSQGRVWGVPRGTPPSGTLNVY